MKTSTKKLIDQGKLNEGDKIKITSITDVFCYTEDIEEWSHLIGKTAIFLGADSAEERPIKNQAWMDDDEDNITYDEAFLVEFIDESGDEDTILLFPWNFRKVEYIPAESETEWLDRIKDNFKH